MIRPNLKIFLAGIVVGVVLGAVPLLTYRVAWSTGLRVSDVWLYVFWGVTACLVAAVLATRESGLLPWQATLAAPVGIQLGALVDLGFEIIYEEGTFPSRTSDLWPLVVAAISMVTFPLAAVGAWCGRWLTRPDQFNG